jgi:hypothetical protein
VNGWNHQGKKWGPIGPHRVVYNSDVSFILCYEVIFNCLVEVPSLLYYNKLIDKFGSQLCGSLSVPKFIDSVFAKTIPKARFQSLKMSVLGLFSRKLGLLIQARESGPLSRKQIVYFYCRLTDTFTYN